MPLSYGLPIDLLGAQGIDSFRGKKLVDYGYGNIGHQGCPRSRQGCPRSRVLAVRALASMQHRGRCGRAVSPKAVLARLASR